LPKPQARKVLQQLIGAKSSEHCVNGCQNHSWHLSMLETELRKLRSRYEIRKQQ